MQRSKYRILGQIGQGQFGQVFCAVHRQTGELVALKDLDRQRFPTSQFLRELCCLVSLRHPNIVACQALEHNQTGRYVVMDYCEGGTLRDVMESGSLSLPQGLKLIADILLGLGHAHDRQIVHCDIKPENILLNLVPGGWIARLSDFGIARLSQKLVHSSSGRGYTGSPAYMAPERFYGQCSSVSDLYAVGVILFELIVGKRPFSGVPSQLMFAHLNQRVEIPDTVPSILKATIAKALEKLPQRRFTSANEMLHSVVLATEKLTATHFSDCRLYASTASQSASCAFAILRQEPLSAPITHLAVGARQVYLGMSDRIDCHTYTDSLLTGKRVQQWQVKLPAPIVALNLQPQACFAITRSAQDYSIYHLPRTLTSADLEKGDRLTPLSGKVRKLVSTVTPQERWLAIAYTTAIFSSHQAQSASSSRHTVFRLFESREGWTKGLCIPLALQLITPSVSFRDRFLAVEQHRTTWGVLINLKPLKVTRIALEIAPAFIVAQTWGYLLADRQGRIVVLDQDGETMGRFDVHAPISAIAACGESGFLIATWLEQQGIGILYTIDLTAAPKSP